ncbi:MAG: hypothetical protein CVV10_02400 [Gammaproteobacteria bacterium HGW-Gammaproteobacteria-14]|nr:MAG: hypothetical protein CVV10_02400 [Gammaproteobacteria bacterium HGW-Gammaproteobacteria-14]
MVPPESPEGTQEPDVGKQNAEQETSPSDKATAENSAQQSSDRQSASGEGRQPVGDVDPPVDVIADLTRIGAAMAVLLNDSFQLLRAESRLWASALLLILMLTMAVGFLLAAAAVLLVAAPAMLLVELGWLGPTLALLVSAAVLLLLALLAVLTIRRLSADMGFRRSRRALLKARQLQGRRSGASSRERPQ